MREYKFRGKAKYNEKRHKINEWIFGDLRINSKGQTFICERQTLLETEVKPETVGQYTGLHDKNGKEIYEGDIVKVKLYKGEEEKYFIGKVEYFGSNFIVDADNNSEYHIYDLDEFGIDYRYNLEDCEVIGNIYDNPELLEEGE